jgi:uncharacterized protein (TIGR03382 family)
VEVFVSHDAVAGEYSGDIRVSWDGGEATVPVSLGVWPFALPASASLKTCAAGLGGTSLLALGGLVLWAAVRRRRRVH